MLRVLSLGDGARAEAIARLCDRALAADPAIDQAARVAIAEVRAGGDAAVRALTERFEGRALARLELSREERRSGAGLVEPEVRRALTRARDRIARFHAAEAERVRGLGFAFTDEEGAELALRIEPLARVGLYAPGGTARYPSSVLMAAVPARAAGVASIALCCPRPSPEVLLAAELAGVDRLFAIGGAQAIAALAYGTESVPRVDKVAGPGNAYVAAAKRAVFGDVAIDQIAGPSEVLVIADREADPRLVAADLLAQAEHDAAAYPVLVATDEALARAAARELERQIADLPRRAIAEAAVRQNGAAIVAADLDEALAIAERFAPEHLELHLGARLDEALGRARSAGAIFAGAHTPEAAGDYLAGPSHVLPTGGAARFGSPLGVHDFVKRTSVIRYAAGTLAGQRADLERLAEVEGLAAHGRAVAARFPEGR